MVLNVVVALCTLGQHKASTGSAAAAAPTVEDILQPSIKEWFDGKINGAELDRRKAEAELASSQSAKGFCDYTDSNTALDCTGGDKGNFPWHGHWTWNSAFAACKEECMKCARCNYISVSLKWKACEWHNKCDLTELKTDVQGFQSAVVKRGS